MTNREALPRRFGEYLLTAVLSEDALGRVYRAIRLSPERGFVRLRVLEGPEISEDAVLDAIQENGEIHAFLKNPAITRGVHMDAVEGIPFIAWNEESGRTLDALLWRGPQSRRQVPAEHALLIAEKVATALDYAHNTTVDGERTLHGLVWPGFVSISDDGEPRLTGFGLASAFVSSMEKPLFSREVAPYLSPERRLGGALDKNSDVFSVGVLLFELLTGRLPSADDPVGDVRAAARDESTALAPEIASVLRLSLSPAEARYQSSGELRRELGKLLFSGPYAPSTFNLAYFLNNLFGAEIEEETRARLKEASLDLGALPEIRAPLIAAPAKPPAPAAFAALAAEAPGSSPRKGPPPSASPTSAPPKSAPPSRRAPIPFILAGLLVAAVLGGVYAIARKPSPPLPLPSAVLRPTPAPPPPATPEPDPTPSVPTSKMSDTEFHEEVSRRVALELKRLEEQLRRSAQKAEAPPAAGLPAEPSPKAAVPDLEPTAAEPAPEEPQAESKADPVPVPDAPEPARSAISESPMARGEAGEEPTVSIADPGTPPRIKNVVKPIYPPLALRQRIGGIVILRVLVSEAGRPLEVEVVRGVRAGISEAAAAAVRRWTFEPSIKDGVPVQAWTTIPIPFKP